MLKSTCCFFGHRSIHETEELKTRLAETVEKLIAEEKVGVFLFGSKSRFDRLCHEVVTKLKEKYPHVKRIYVRAEFPVITEDYRSYLLKSYEDTYYPETVKGAGKAAYVVRNREMIDHSDFCVVYYAPSLAPKDRKSGTEIALHYALKRNKTVCIFP